MTNNIDNIKNKICTGIPELKIPPNEPIIINNLVIYDTDNVKFYLRDLEIYGFCDFIINSFHVDIDKLHIDFSANVKHLHINTTYDVDLHILTQIVHKGKIKITVGE